MLTGDIIQVQPHLYLFGKNKEQDGKITADTVHDRVMTNHFLTDYQKN